MSGGYIKLHRRWFEGWVSTLTLGQRAVFLHLLYLARWKTGVAKVYSGGRLVEIRRGQCLVSERELADAVGVSRGSVRGTLRLLSEEGAILAQRTARNRTLITVSNYETYQGSDRVDSPAVSPAMAQRWPSDKERIGKKGKKGDSARARAVPGNGTPATGEPSPPAFHPDPDEPGLDSVERSRRRIVAAARLFAGDQELGKLVERYVRGQPQLSFAECAELARIELGRGKEQSTR